MYSTSCVNTHHDATTFEVAGMVWNRKNWMSQKQNKIFWWNKEILILQKNYMFRRLQEVTFHFIEETTFKNI